MSEPMPIGWQRRSLHSLGEYKNGFAFNELQWSEHGLPIVRIAQITGTQGVVDRYPGRLPATFRINSGDLIFSWSGTLTVVRWDGGPAWLNQHLFKVVPAPGVDASLLFHVLQSSVAEMNKRTHGSTMKHIKRGELHEFVVPVPVAVDEQCALAAVLDTLDTVIHETEAIIVKLKAAKQGLLHDLLTRGIDANGELRPLQAEAPHLYKQSPLGWIPKEWETKVLGQLIADTYRYPSYFGINYVESGVPEVRGELVHADGSLSDVMTAYRFISEQTASRFPRVRLRLDDFVMTVRGTIGKFALVPPRLEGAVITANLLKLSPERSVTQPRWLMHTFLSAAFQERLDAACSATTIKTIQIPALLAIQIATPGLPEQKTISARLSALDSKLAMELASLYKLKIKKSGLMDDLLTGRVRVTPLLEGATP